MLVNFLYIKLRIFLNKIKYNQTHVGDPRLTSGIHLRQQLKPETAPQAALAATMGTKKTQRQTLQCFAFGPHAKSHQGEGSDDAWG